MVIAQCEIIQQIGHFMDRAYKEGVFHLVVFGVDFHRFLSICWFYSASEASAFQQTQGCMVFWLILTQTEGEIRAK